MPVPRVHHPFSAMATIYLSSTYEDLKEYRRVVVEALRKSGYQVIAMEDYVAADQRPVDQCLKDVEKADIYIGLFAFRYGYVPPSQHNNPQGWSITELEFRRAEALHKSCLTFVVNETTDWPRSYDDARTSADKGDRINTLRQYLLTEKLAGAFASPYELAALVLAAVAKHLTNQKKPASPDATEPATPAAVTWDVEKNDSPYPGLMHFTRKYAPVFFGRDAEIRDILDRMRLPEGRFILISGDSGVGKSSVVDAGILPKLEAGGLPGGESCDCVRMVPSQGQDPWNSLLAALGSMATRAGLRPDAIIEDLNREPETLPGHIRRIVKDGTESQALVLFLDQMEELFTSQDRTKSNQFLSALYHAAQEKTVWVLATIRSDHLQYCHRHPDMVKVLRGSGHFPVGPVESFMLTDMVVKPARCAGLRITDQLAHLIVEETGSKEVNLPLLGFVLEQLFENRVNHDLSEDMYKRLGRVAGAIEAHVKTVEEKIERTVGAKTGQVLPAIFQTLAKVQKEEGVPTRNRPPLSGFTGTLRNVVDLLVTERLLRTEGEGEAATVSLSHEKLFEAWPALQEYVETHKKMLVDRTLLESRARKWVNMGKPWFSGLASGREYNDFRWAGGTATSVMKDYLAASRRAQWLVNMAVTFVLLLVAGTTWLWQKGYNLDQAGLKVRSLFVSIHLAPEMQPVSGGTFRQGDTHGLGGAIEQPVHEVRIKSFAIGRFEVTFEEYDRFAVATGRSLPGDQGWGRGRRPVINVSWHEAKDYADWLSRETGKRFRLPTESEWEYAARGGGKDDIWAGTSDEEQLKNYAVYAANSQNRTAPVGEDKGRKPNARGLYDMSGNVFEWVEDCAHNDYQGAPTDGTAWLEADGGNCKGRVIRGGSWTSARGTCVYRTGTGTSPSTGSTASASVLPRTFRNPMPCAL
ncbi:MAG: SUMF1/EgtB/PvdO family nonheme iron enzyme [Nitrospira defluvii]|nr:SUMF1/EgtB/PvdO family nonheme iron enzyme [Nitrospira defluvii]